MNTLRKRLDSVEERILFQQHMDMARAFEGRSLARIIREYAASGGWRREVAVKMLVAL